MPKRLRWNAGGLLRRADFARLRHALRGYPCERDMQNVRGICASFLGAGNTGRLHKAGTRIPAHMDGHG